MLGFPGGAEVKNPPASAKDVGSVPGLGRFPWNRKWQPTLVFLPGKFHGQRSLVGYSAWGYKESGRLSTHVLDKTREKNTPCPQGAQILFGKGDKP